VRTDTQFKNNFIEDITYYITKHREIPTPTLWAETVAGHLLTATILHPTTTLNKFSPIKGIRLVSADINVSPSGIFFKGFPVEEILNPILTRFSEVMRLNVLIPASHTSAEGLIEHLEENRVGVDWQEEMTLAFKSMTSIQTYKTRIESYSKYIDGTPIFRKRLRRKSKKTGEQEKHQWVVRDYRYNLLGATTRYFFDIVDKSIFIQGLGCRVNWLYYEGENPKPTPDDLFDVDYEVDVKENQGYIDNYTGFLVELNNRDVKFRYLSVMPEAQSLFIDFNEKMKEIPEDEDLSLEDENILRSIQVRAMVKAVVLAQKHRIGSLWKYWCDDRTRHTLPKLKEHMLIITKEDTIWGIEREQIYINHAHKILAKWGQHELAQQEKKRGGHLQSAKLRAQETLLTALQNAGVKGLSTKQCTNMIGISSTPILKLMATGGPVKFYKIKTKTKPKIVWVHQDSTEQFEKLHKVKS